MVDVNRIGRAAFKFLITGDYPCFTDSFSGRDRATPRDHVLRVGAGIVGVRGRELPGPTMRGAEYRLRWLNKLGGIVRPHAESSF